MKKTLLIAVFAITVLASCTKDDYPPQKPRPVRPVNNQINK